MWNFRTFCLLTPNYRARKVSYSLTEKFWSKQKRQLLILNIIFCWRLTKFKLCGISQCIYWEAKRYLFQYSFNSDWSIASRKLIILSYGCYVLIWKRYGGTSPQISEQLNSGTFTPVIAIQFPSRYTRRQRAIVFVGQVMNNKGQITGTTISGRMTRNLGDH